MFDVHVIKEATRTFSMEGRQFTASYLLGEERDAEGQRCVIRAVLREAGNAGSHKESTASVQLIYLHPDIGRRIFEVIADATHDVFLSRPAVRRRALNATADWLASQGIAGN